MSLTAGLWTSVSGLLAHGEKMNVVGNNISNVNTLGFKGARMDFQDFVYQYVGTNGGVGQVGRGTSIGAIMNDFQQGSFEHSTENTDIGIDGNGFFAVKPLNSNQQFYTRAGNFRFDASGYLVDPNGYVLQGWAVDNSATSMRSGSGSTSTQGTSIVGAGVPVDIKLETFSCAPKHTNNLSVSVNLDSYSGNNKTSHEDYPFFSLLHTWDATPNALGEIIPLGSDAAAFSTTLEVYDEGGQMHKLTVYFDRVEQTLDTNINGMKNNEIVWEYIVTMDPAEDVRNFSNPPTAIGEVPDQYKGLLMSGTLTFNSSGEMRDMTAYVPTSQNMGDMTTWVQAPLSNNGYPVIAPNFSGRDGASSAWDATGTQINKEADGFLIELNLGMRSKSQNWGGTAPKTIAGWVATADPATGPWKHVKSENSAGSLVPVTDSAGNPIVGVVGSDGNVYVHKSGTFTPGEVPDSSGLLYEQKTAADGLDEHEALIGNHVYVQSRDESPGAEGYMYTDTNGVIAGNIIKLDSSGLYYVQGTSPTVTYTASDLASMGVKLEPYADNSNPLNPPVPVATSRAVADTANPIYKYDASGNPIPQTTTAMYTGMGNYGELQANASTSYSNNTGKNFFERSRAQDGYSYGELRYVTVGQNGVLSGAYSNGVTLELYQIVLYDFPSTQNLRREGGNLFSETRESGMAYRGAAGTGSFGTTEGNSLEQSNVDLAREFVNMITTQRGFQANSKNITTIDTMLEQVIQMKR